MGNKLVSERHKIFSVVPAADIFVSNFVQNSRPAASKNLNAGYEINQYHSSTDLYKKS